MKKLYPKGSIITKKGEENKMYCIVKKTKDAYECVQYPMGKILPTEYIKIPFDDVSEIYFWGKIFEDEKQEIKNKKLEELMRKAERL